MTASKRYNSLKTVAHTTSVIRPHHSLLLQTK